MSELQKIIEVWRITEWRDGSIWKTEYVEDRWVGIDEKPPAGFLFTPFSTGKSEEWNKAGKNEFRRV
jgi:hypothetical protein